jgi:OHCU decarboxylase
VAGTPGHSVRLDQVNEMSQEEFVRTFSGLFQGPDWVVERAYAQRPFSDTNDLRRSFQEALFAANPDEQEQLIGSYPDLGSLSVAEGDEGERSKEDQSVLGLTRLAEQEQQELSALTQAYRDRFGFTLIMAVRDHENFNQLLRHGWERLNNSPAQEHAAALIEIAKIATHRFDQLVADANPIHSARTRHLDN